MTDPYLAPVRILTDRYLPEGVRAGATGVVVEVWEDDAYEVEVSNPATGETIALLTLTSSEVELVEQPEMPARARIGDLRSNLRRPPR